MRFDIFEDEAGEGRYTAIGDNGEPMAQSEGYSGDTSADRLAAAERGAKDLVTAVIREFRTGIVQGHPTVTFKPSQFRLRE